ncbi:recombinase family protein [Micromonospora sp. NPDC005194]|uniref:recombinase family protein n=1 Tax=Micromonospora sp. NPDC005194 TaxID=3156870 RepID=UPI0033A01974
MDVQLIERAHWGDLAGMHFAGLVRLSFEVSPRLDQGQGSTNGFMTGRDIRGRGEQMKDCRSYVEQRSGLYVYTYEEPDTSAYKRKRMTLPDGRTVYRVVRPVFEGALEDLKRGLSPDGQRLDGLIVYDIDRLTRDNRHLEDCIEVVQHFGRPIIDITGTLDLLTDNGRTVARIVVATYNKQSADTARRVKRKHHALQQAGIPVGGRRPFGWQDDKRTLVPDEADVIRAGARRLLEGAPINAVVAEWNAAGVRTASGRPWIRSTLKVVFRNPRLCGYRSRKVHGYNEEFGKTYFNVEIVRNAAGEPVIGQWESILTVAEWEAVTAVIGKSERHGLDLNSRKYLLSGILRCGRPTCGSWMRATKTTRRRTAPPGHFSYTCPAKAVGGCGGTAILGQQTDEHVVAAVIAKYELEAQRREAVSAPVPWPREQEFGQLRQDIQELTAAWRGRKISAARYFALLPELETEEQTLSREREDWLARQYPDVGQPLSLRSDWANLTLAEQRSYIKRVLTCVVVLPAGGGVRGRWNPNRLQPVWRAE